MHQFFGIDIETGILAQRSYRWLITRVSGLFSIEHSRLRLKIYPPKEQPQAKRYARRRK